MVLMGLVSIFRSPRVRQVLTQSGKPRLTALTVTVLAVAALTDSINPN